MSDEKEAVWNSKEENTLFDLGNRWEDQWRGMPEFIMKEQEPYAIIRVRFRCEEDLKQFGELIGQKNITPKSSLWFPKLKQGGKRNQNRYYGDEK